MSRWGSPPHCVHVYPHVYSVEATNAVVPELTVNAVFDPTGAKALPAPVSADAAAFAGHNPHLASVAYAVPNVTVTTVALAAGDAPGVTEIYPDTSLSFAFSEIVGLLPAPLPPATVGVDAASPPK